MDINPFDILTQRIHPPFNFADYLMHIAKLHLPVSVDMDKIGRAHV